MAFVGLGIAGCFTALFLASGADAGPNDRTADTPEARALVFLSREVPRWSRENKCFSCHNNGDAARALYRAVRAGYRIGDKVLADTTGWLSRPEGWKDNRGDARFSDKKLADLQFAAALAEATRAGLVKDKAPLIRAAEMVVTHQEDDGSWRITPDAPIGAPTTWGRQLATVIARRTLVLADDRRFQPAIDRADKWLRGRRPETVLGAAAQLLGPQENLTNQQRSRSLKTIRQGQSPGGGWGPYVTSPPEPFDTAVVLLALGQLKGDPQIDRQIEHGRRYLVDAQLPDGSWPETTRPAGAESYAQRMSTAAWASMALMATRPK